MRSTHSIGIGSQYPRRNAAKRELRGAFAANLRRLRHAKGSSQEDLAHEAGINRSYMSKLEKGDARKAAPARG